MTKKLFKALLIVLLLVLVTGCTKRTTKTRRTLGTETYTKVPEGDDEYSLDLDLPYPTTGYATKDSDSWLQIDPDAETIDIDWYMDSTTFSLSQTVIDQVERVLKIKLHMSYPVSDDGTKLSTMIAGDMLPDIITITDTSTREQLQEDGYVYAINRLASKYAPTLLDRIDLSEYIYYQASDGNLYTLSNNFYTDENVEAYEAMGNTLLVNSCLNVRKDYLIAYLEYKYGVKESDPDFYTNAYTETTTPSGFIEMCKWVKKTYGIANNVPMAVMDSTTINRLQEYFGVEIEDKDGNYVYPQETSEMKEVYMFLNELYRENILTSGALSATNSTIGQNIANGNVFLSMVASQNFINYFKLAYQSGIDYVPVVITNAAGTAPLLRNLAGYGFRCSMITKNAEYVDRIIKMFDYLMSGESMTELYYGTEGVTFEYDVRPGEKDENGVYYKYGKMHYTTEVANAIASDNFGSYNIRKQSFLYDPMFARLSYGTPEGAITLNDYLLYNLKAAVNPYTYNRSIMDFTYDTQNKKYNRMINLKKTLSNLWEDNLAEIITQSTAEKASKVYEEVLQSARDYGLETFIEYQNTSFKKYKAKFGITGCAWIRNQSTYTAPEVRLMGFVSENLEMPDSFKR